MGQFGDHFIPGSGIQNHLSRNDQRYQKSGHREKLSFRRTIMRSNHRKYLFRSGFE
uniref:Uncharacterized protein n=1 Tax=Romanomermis culicivorax TaxID=13658 RepID=A0A915I675_ROMCU